MKWVVPLLLLFFTVSLAAQQPSMPSAEQPNMPSEEQKQSMLSNQDVRHQIQAKFDIDPSWSDSKLSTTVTDDSVIVSGYCQDEEKHQAALSVAQSYAGDRRVVDEISIGPPYQY